MPRASEAPCRDLSLAFGDDDAILAAFHEDGVVVVRDVLSSAEVANALDELWSSKQLLGRDASITRNDPATWSGAAWPQQDGGRNFLESLDPFKDRCCWDLVQNPQVVHLLRLLYGGEVFTNSSGRWGVMRPTEGHPEWRTEESWLHWDQNPWTEPNFERVQGFVCLTNHTPRSGGFLCAPGFHKRWHSWGEAHPLGSVRVNDVAMTENHGAENPFIVPTNDPVQEEVVRVLAPEGAMVLWDSRLPHQNYPNTGGDFRVVHYLTFFPFDEIQLASRRRLFRRRLIVMRACGQNPSDFFFPAGMTRLGRQITGAPRAVVTSGTQSEAEGVKTSAVAAQDEDEVESQHPEDDADESPQLIAAIQLAVQAGEKELEGQLDASVQLLRRATKTWPDIEGWYDVIFAA